MDLCVMLIQPHPDQKSWLVVALAAAEQLLGLNSMQVKPENRF